MHCCDQLMIATYHPFNHVQGGCLEYQELRWVTEERTLLAYGPGTHILVSRRERWHYLAHERHVDLLFHVAGIQRHLRFREHLEQWRRSAGEQFFICGERGVSVLQVGGADVSLALFAGTVRIPRIRFPDLLCRLANRFERSA